MGSGKSTVGKRLAQLLQIPFFDLDTMIENRQGQSIEAIFKHEGEPSFRQYEQQSLREWIENGTNSIIACGGGTPCFFNNMELLTQHSTSIYLHASINELFNNLQAQKTQRPLLKNKSAEELPEYIETTLSQRELFYRQAKIIVNTDGKTTGEIAGTILSQLRLNF